MIKINLKYVIKAIILLLFSHTVIAVKAQNCIRWMQQASVSPDAKWIAFEYKGNIFKVPFQGGKAIQLTHELSYNGYPVWSHDGSKVAFASDRNGNFDVYIMSGLGAAQQRLTYNSSKDIPYEFSKDDLNIYFGTTQHDVFLSVRYPADQSFAKLFKVPAAGGASKMVNSAGMEFVHFNHNDDRIIFQDNKGSAEGVYRKHAKSSVTRDIITYDTKTGIYTRISPYIGEDREPVWGKGDDFYYLSERAGDQNLFQSSLADTGKVKQLTFFEKNPVRNLSIAENGSLVFSQNGDLYSISEGGRPIKIKVLLKELRKDSTITNAVTEGSSDFDVSADGKQIAFVLRGDIYVTSTDSNSITRRITNTSYIERMVNFSPDGRRLLYSVENGSSWDITQVALSDPSQHNFYAPGKLVTTSMIGGVEDEFQGVYSPDGKQIAFLENRQVLKSYDIEKKSIRTLLPAGINFSMVDGDQFYRWSPDSKYLLVQSTSNNVMLISLEDPGKRINFTKSAFENKNPYWASCSNSMYLLTSKNGLTNFTHSKNLFDIQQTFFNRSFWDHDRLAVQNKTTADSKNIPGKETDLFADTVYHDKKITDSPADIQDFAVSGDGKTIYMLASYEQDLNLYTIDVHTKSVQLLSKLNVKAAKMKLTDSGKTVVIYADKQFKLINTGSGKISAVHISTKASVNLTQEQISTYDHVYNLERKRFMDPNLNGVDFKYFYANYRQFLGNINNSYDFKTLLEELIGELNNSHMGVYYNPVLPTSTSTASLGLLYDLTDFDRGLEVKEIIAGGPFDFQKSQMRKGFIIDQIDGNKITPKEDWARYLNNKTDSILRIGFHDPSTGHQYEERVTAISVARENMEKRWVKQMEHLTDSLSGGKIGYVYIPQMSDENFRSFYDTALGRYQDKKALLVDTRFNRGGNLLDLLTTFLAGKLYLTERRQGLPTSYDEPGTKWNKPSCILVGEANYSDAFRVPFIYQKLGLGKLVGMPVPGTGTAAAGERLQMPGFGVNIGQGGTYYIGDDHPTENYQLLPDILVNNDYSIILSGRDQQIEAAVKHLLITIH